MILFGFMLVALPLLIAVVRAAIQLDDLAGQSEELVVQSGQAAQHNQILLERLDSMERNARQYLVLGDRELIDFFASDLQQLIVSLTVLQNLPHDNRTGALINQLASANRATLDTLRSETAESAAIAEAVGGLAALGVVADEISRKVRQYIALKLNSLDQNTRAARRQLAWQSAALIPGTLALVLFFTLRIARPGDRSGHQRAGQRRLFAPH